MRKTSEELVEYFDRLATEGYFADFEPWERTQAEGLLARMKIRPGWRILEPGCGRGRFSALLADAVGSNGYVLAVDCSPQMIEFADSRRHPEWVEFRCADFPCDKMPMDRFNAIVCFNVFPHMADKDVVARMAEMLVPDGPLYIAHSVSRETVNRIHTNSFCPLLRSHLLPGDDELMELLETAGFRVTEMESGDVFFCSAVPL